MVLAAWSLSGAARYRQYLFLHKREYPLNLIEPVIDELYGINHYDLHATIKLTSNICIVNCLCDYNDESDVFKNKHG